VKRKSEAVAGRHRSRQRMAALRPITLVDQVVDAMIKAAAEGHILPGDRVVEADIANELNVSLVPVREALRLLESQGIVVNTPYRGMRLMEVDGKRLHQILMCEAALSNWLFESLGPHIAGTPAYCPKWRRLSPR
jgi:DNA-binding GntR family transcriptional regulator